MGDGSLLQVGEVWSGLSLGFLVCVSVFPIPVSGGPFGRVACDSISKVCGSSTGGGWLSLSISYALGVDDFSRVGGGWSGLSLGFLVCVSVLPIPVSGGPFGRVAYLPEISRTRQPVRTLRRVGVSHRISLAPWFAACLLASPTAPPNRRERLSCTPVTCIQECRCTSFDSRR